MQAEGSKKKTQRKGRRGNFGGGWDNANTIRGSSGPGKQGLLLASRPNPQIAEARGPQKFAFQPPTRADAAA